MTFRYKACWFNRPPKRDDTLTAKRLETDFKRELAQIGAGDKYIKQCDGEELREKLLGKTGGLVGLANVNGVTTKMV